MSDYEDELPTPRGRGGIGYFDYDTDTDEDDHVYESPRPVYVFPQRRRRGELSPAKRLLRSTSATRRPLEGAYTMKGLKYMDKKQLELLRKMKKYESRYHPPAKEDIKLIDSILRVKEAEDVPMGMRRVARRNKGGKAQSPKARSVKRKSPKRKSPVRKSRKSPVRKSRKSPVRKSRKSPVRKSRKSPVRKSRKSPVRKSRKSPVRKSRKSVKRKSPKRNKGGKAQSPVRKSRKFEDCVMAVKAKQPKKCFSRKKWIGGKGCYNPWAVCSKSVGRKKKTE